MGEELWKKPFVQVLVSKDHLHCCGVLGPCSLLQLSCVTSHKETGAKAEQQRQILQDLSLSGNQTLEKPQEDETRLLPFSQPGNETRDHFIKEVI